MCWRAASRSSDATFSLDCRSRASARVRASVSMVSARDLAWVTMPSAFVVASDSSCL